MPKRQRELVKLVLQVSHQCNLKCSYCSSDAGKWGSGETGYMNPELARRALRLFARRHGKIGTIYLFGGEPTLNVPAIDAVCDETEFLVRSGELEDMPIIGFTTNGTIVNDAVVRLLSERQYLKVSVSIDGAPEVHDRFRVDIRGKPTYNKIVNNVRQLRERFGKPKTIEITYSPEHQKYGFSLWDMMRHLYADTGVNTISVEIAYNTHYVKSELDPMQLDRERTLEEIDFALRQSMRSVACSDNPIFFYNIIGFMQTIGKPHRLGFCPASSNYFTVSKSGEIFPCQNLPENPNTRIGHIDDPDLDMKIEHAPIRRFIKEANSRADHLLGDAWFANFCKVCPVYNLSETGLMESYAPSRATLYERMSRVFLEELLIIAGNDSMYRQFEDNVKRQSDNTFELNVS